MAVAADVPGIYDIVIAGKGYIFANPVAPNLPFRTQRAKMGYTPTFISRSNTQGDLGDNQQDFWMTASMRDWSLGEDQKFFHITDAEKSRQYWFGQNLNISTPGQVTIQRAVKTETFAAACTGAGTNPAGGQTYVASSTNLYEVASDGTITDRGAHGCGGAVTAFATDGVNLYISGTAATKTRKYSISGHTFADFCAQATESLVFLNNTLYGCKAGVLYTIDSSGSAVNSFTYKDATGGTLTSPMKLIAFGGKVILLRTSGSTNGAELWEYDGVGVAKTAEYPGNFFATDFTVQSGIIFVIGTEGKVGDGYRTALWYFANGTIGRAWANTTYRSGSAAGSALTPFGNGLLFTDVVNDVVRFYDLTTGGISSVASYTSSGTTAAFETSANYALLSLGSTTGKLFYDSTTVATSATLQTSIVDFESSLTKIFRGVIVDFVADSTGNGGSVDVYYQTDSVTGAYTLLQAGVTTGTEYLLPDNTKGRGISVQVVLNKGTSTNGPVMKRIYVRAAPTLSKFRNGEYILDCTGRAGKTPVFLHNENPHPLTGQQQVVNLSADATSGTLLTITDHLGTFTGIIELENYEVIELRPQEYFVRFTVRQV